jgi:hypothetical protein
MNEKLIESKNYYRKTRLIYSGFLRKELVKRLLFLIFAFTQSASLESEL